jgi:hypothetical protein
MVTQVGYSVVRRSRGRVTPCAICTVYVETRSAGFLVEPQNQGGRFVSGLTSKSFGRFVSGLTLKPLERFSQFGLKTDDKDFSRFGLKIGGGFFFVLTSKSTAMVW